MKSLKTSAFVAILLGALSLLSMVWHITVSYKGMIIKYNCGDNLPLIRNKWCYLRMSIPLLSLSKF